MSKLFKNTIAGLMVAAIAGSGLAFADTTATPPAKKDDKAKPAATPAPHKLEKKAEKKDEKKADKPAATPAPAK